jgi:hypothetical protein
MPPKSKAQRRLMHATAKGAKTGVPKSVAKEYLKSDKAGRKLPERKGRK